MLTSFGVYGSVIWFTLKWGVSNWRSLPSRGDYYTWGSNSRKGNHYRATFTKKDKYRYIKNKSHRIRIGSGFNSISGSVSESKNAEKTNSSHVFFKKSFMFSQKGWRLILDFEVLHADLKCNGTYFVVLKVSNFLNCKFFFLSKTCVWIRL